MCYFHFFGLKAQNHREKKSTSKVLGFFSSRDVDFPAAASAVLLLQSLPLGRQLSSILPHRGVLLGLRVQRSPGSLVLPQRPRAGGEENEKPPRAGRAAVSPRFPSVAVVAVIRGHAVTAVAVLALITSLHAQGRGAGSTGAGSPATVHDIIENAERVGFGAYQIAVLAKSSGEATKSG